MLKIDRDHHNLTILDTPTLAAASITERYDLQEYISNSPDAFFKEIGQELFLFGKEVEPSTNVQDRIDLLAVDKEGTCIVVELKRSNHKLHMLQAISYAAMISQWEAGDFLQLLSDDQEEALDAFLDVDREDINRQQRIILIAEEYDYALLIGAEWLSQQFGVDITCCRIAVAKDSATAAEYLVCSTVYPAPELAKEAISRGRIRAGVGKAPWPDWETALAAISNDAVVSHFKRELAANRESYLGKRSLRYRIREKKRWSMSARGKHAYVWQHGRFEGDVEFWRKGLSKPSTVTPVANASHLSLSLITTDDFAFFNEAATEKLPSREWFVGTPEEDIDGTEVEN